MIQIKRAKEKAANSTGGKPKGVMRDIRASIVQVDAQNGKMLVKELGTDRTFWVKPNPAIHADAKVEATAPFQGNIVDERMAKEFPEGSHVIIEGLIDRGEKNDENTEQYPLLVRWINSEPAPYKDMEKVVSGPLSVTGYYYSKDNEKAYKPTKVILWRGAVDEEKTDAMAQDLTRKFKEYMAKRELTQIKQALDAGDESKAGKIAYMLNALGVETKDASIEGLRAAFNQYAEENELTESKGRIYAPAAETPAVFLMVVKGDEVVETELPLVDQRDISAEDLPKIPEVQEVAQNSLRSPEEVIKDAQYAPVSGTVLNAYVSGISESARQDHGDVARIKIAYGKAYPASQNLESNRGVEALGTIKAPVGTDDQGKPVLPSYGGNLAVNGILVLSPGKVEMDRRTNQPKVIGGRNQFANRVFTSAHKELIPVALGYKLSSEMEAAVEAVKAAAAERNGNGHQQQAKHQQAEAGSAAEEQEGKAQEKPSRPGKAQLSEVADEIDAAVEAVEATDNSQSHSF